MGLGKTKVAVIVIVLAVGYRWFYSHKVLSPILEISTGRIQGVVTKSRNGRDIHEYLGIPYAKPPVGELRFELPVPIEPWEGVKDGTVYAPKCIQVDIISQQFYSGESESCLFLNVFTPVMPEPKKLLPVIVFIHGGLLHYGSGDIFGAKYFADEGVILVTIQYRLGALGFLNTGDGVVRGNMGLKDQVLALKWVQQNIRYFGGDRRKVTIVGESAGASSVHLHMLSKMSKGLFHKAISQSGTATSPFILSRSPRDGAIRYAEKLGCVKESTTAMVDCLKKVDAVDFVKFHMETVDLLHDSLAVFTATIETVNDENAFLVADPQDLLRKGLIESKVPWITGVNAEEGLILSAAFAQNKTLMKALNDDWNDVAPKILFYPRNDELSSKIRQQYFGKVKKISKKHKSKLTNMVSDGAFFYPASESARLQSKVSPVYLYYYMHVGDFSLAHLVCLFRGDYHYILELLMDSIKKWINLNIIGQRHHYYGACHGDEQFLQFNTPLTSDIMPQDGVQYVMSRDFVKLWADFAAHKKELNFKGVNWTEAKHDSPHLRYLLIDMSYGMVDEPFESRIKFWKENYVF